MSISTAQKLNIYNGALLFIGERQLASLSDSVEARRLLDYVWDRGGIKAVLEQGQWNFAMREAKLEYSPSVTKAFGHEYAFEKPTDWVRIVELCEDDFFKVPLLDYSDNPGYIYASISDIYVRYVSNDGDYGEDYSLWPENFKNFAHAWFGGQIVWKLTQSVDREERVLNKIKTLLTTAKSFDAMSEPTKFRPSGNWRNARRAGSRGDRGKRNTLIG